MKGKVWSLNGLDSAKTLFCSLLSNLKYLLSSAMYGYICIQNTKNSKKLQVNTSWLQGLCHFVSFPKGLGAE